MAAAVAGAGVVRDVTHHRIGDRIPEQRHREGQPGVCRIQTEHLGVIQHREVRDAVDGNRQRPLSQGVAENAAGGHLLLARCDFHWRSLHEQAGHSQSKSPPAEIRPPPSAPEMPAALQQALHHLHGDGRGLVDEHDVARRDLC